VISASFDAPAINAIAERSMQMSERGNLTAEVQHDAVADAPSDHHLDEVAEMIERAQADEGPQSSTGHVSEAARAGRNHG
jgi:hypothetical protein